MSKAISIVIIIWLSLFALGTWSQAANGEIRVDGTRINYVTEPVNLDEVKIEVKIEDTVDIDKYVYVYGENFNQPVQVEVYMICAVNCEMHTRFGRVDREHCSVICY